MKILRKKGIKDSRFGPATHALDALQKRRQQRIEETMRRPLYQEATRSLFFIVIVFVDAFLPLELYYDFPAPNNGIIALIVLGMLVYGEIRLYNTTWGKKGRWSLEKNEQTVEKRNEKKRITK
jgi:hypothetical protein